MILKGATRRKLDAIDRLRSDHMRVELLFMQIRATKDVQRRAQLFEVVRQQLEMHSRVEETVFYPACEKFEELRPMILESYEEHKELKTLLADMAEMNVRNPRFDAKLKLLMEDVSHHVREEESFIFPAAREHFTQARLERMASELDLSAPRRRRKPSKAA